MKTRVFSYTIQLNARVGGKATVDGKHDAADEGGGGIREEEHQRTEQLARLTKATHRRAAKDLLGSCGGLAIVIVEKGSAGEEIVCPVE